MRTVNASFFDVKDERRQSREECRVTLDVGPQRLFLYVPEFSYRLVETLMPSLASVWLEGKPRTSLVPAIGLALKAKQFDDGLYAAIELAVARGLGNCPGKKDVIVRLLAAAMNVGDAAGAPMLAAAAHLGGSGETPKSIERATSKLLDDFLKDPLRSRPISFYTWTRELGGVFQHDRILQTELDTAEQSESLARGLERDPKLLGDYSKVVELAARMTNPAVLPDLRSVLRSLDEGSPMPKAAVFPASRSKETDLMKELFPDRKAIPEGFDLAAELVDRITSARLSLAPTAESGWYDYQSFALEALVTLDQTPEAKHLVFMDSYRKEMIALFKALLGITRETHAKQLEQACFGARMPPLQPKLSLRPGLTVEPLSTYYLRQAQSYRFIRSVLEEFLGPDTLDGVRRLTPDGPVSAPLSRDLRFMEGLFHGAYCRSGEEIGMPLKDTEDVGSGNGAAADCDLLQAWWAGADEDDDLSRDVRMMVPIFYDLGRRKTKVWVVLGLSPEFVSIGFHTRPRIIEIRLNDGTVLSQEQVQIETSVDSQQIASIVSGEVYVDEILDREAFRAHCDRYETAEAILQNLR